MSENEIEFSPVNNPIELATYYEALSQPGVASLQVTNGGGKEHPVVLLEQEERDYLLFDLSAIRDLAPQLRRGVKFTLHGYTPGGLVQSNPMTMRELINADGRLLAYADWPLEINVKQRRASFRASLRLGMDVGVLLHSEDEETQDKIELQGDLKDLSATGCLAEFFMQDGVSRVLPDLDTEIQLFFPNGTKFEVEAKVRHLKTDNDRQVLTVGFEFSEIGQAKEKDVWNFVREIEREASRSAGEGGNKAPSELFQVKDENDKRLGRRHGHQYATPMARRLARIAGYLDSQMVVLKQGQPVNSHQLSLHADRLLDMLDDSREETLFAVHCIHRESRWIRHGLSVAVRLADLLTTVKVPRDVRKAVTAAAMVHDLGKGMMAPEIWRAVTLSTEVYKEMQLHVDNILGKLEGCKWLSPVVRDNVISQINERLDGSGYPDGLRSNELGQLARAAAVVDVLDALQRARPDRAAMTTVAAHKFIQARTEQFDEVWIDRYIRHFGPVPIGSLLRFDSGEFAWVVGLDRNKKIARVRVSPHRLAPDSKLGEPLEGSALRELGKIKDIVVPEN